MIFSRTKKTNKVEILWRSGLRSDLWRTERNKCARSTDLSMASGYCMSKDLRNCSTFRTPKTFWKETSIHPKVVWKKTLGEAPCLYLPRCHVLLSETAKGSTVPFTQRVQDPVFAKFTRFHALNKNHVPGLGFFSGPGSRNAALTSLMLWHWWHW